MRHGVRTYGGVRVDRVGGAEGGAEGAAGQRADQGVGQRAATLEVG